MSRVVVIAHLNHDRIWRLDAPLQSGSRISWREREINLGGGAYFTGSQLLKLGHDTALVSSLGNDVLGCQAWSTLCEMGFEMDHVLRRNDGTHITEILLEPSGERTILNAYNRPTPVFTLSREISASAAYINCLNPDGQILTALNSMPFVTSQLPLSETAVPRPADLVIGSRADFPGVADETLWSKAFQMCGTRLKHLVMTDGSQPITVYDGRQARTVRPMKRATVRNAIGAGDNFSANLISAMLRGMGVKGAVDAASKATAVWLEERTPP